MLKTLIGIRIRSMFAGMYMGGKKKNRGKGMAVFVLAFLALAFVAFFFFVYVFADALVVYMHKSELDWLYFALFMLAAFLFMFVGSIFMTKTEIFDAKDNELLLSMPIKPIDIVISRMSVVYIFNVIFESVIMIPAIVAYDDRCGFSVSATLAFIVVFIMLPLLSLSVSSVFGWVIAIVAAKFKNRAITKVMASLVLLVAFYYVYFQLIGNMDVIVTDPGSIINEEFARKYVALYWVGASIAKFDILAFLLVCGISLAAFAVASVLIIRSFIRITTEKSGAKKKEYVRREAKVRGVRKALIGKEMSKYTSSVAYMLNDSLGIAFSLVLAVLAVINRDTLISVIEVLEVDIVNIGEIAALGTMLFLSSMTLISAPSISLEGKNLWIIKSIPVNTKDVLIAKLSLHMIIAAPVAAVSALLFGLAIGNDAVVIITFIIVNVLMVLLVDTIGLMLNLIFPRFDWINENIPIKQGASVNLTMLASMLISVGIAALFGLFSAFLGGIISALLIIILMLALNAAMILIIMKKGVAIFDNL